jgi:hypothetical protein
MLFGLHSGAPPRMGRGPSVGAASVTAVGISVAHASALLPALGAENVLAPSRMTEAREIAIAARWIDDFPLKFNAQDGGLLVAVRVRGP